MVIHPQRFKTDEEWERNKKYKRDDYYKHKDKRNKQTKIYRSKVKDIKEYKIKKSISDKKYRLKNVDILKEKNKEYRLKNNNKLKLYKKQYQLKNKDIIKQKRKQHRLENKYIIKENRKIYYLKNSNILKEKQKQRRIYDRDNVNKSIENSNMKAKIKAMNILGGATCKHCGNTDFRVLQFDHINGGGRLEKKNIMGGYMAIVRGIIKNPTQAKLIYQVLCANCNTIKIIENDEHPHIINPTDAQKKRRLIQQKAQLKLKTSVMEALGGIVCKGCGFIDIRALQVDHIHGGGGKELKTISTSGVYRKIRDDPTCRHEYQVLCANCNMIKRVVNGEGKGKQNINK